MTIKRAKFQKPQKSPKPEKVIENKTSYDCPACVIKHVAKARTLLNEYISNNAYVLELGMCIGELGCAEDHLRMSGIEELCEVTRLIRLAIQKDSKDVSNLANLDELLKNLL